MDANFPELTNFAACISPTNLESSKDCCIIDGELVCGIDEPPSASAHIVMGISTIIHSFYTAIMWASIVKRNPATRSRWFFFAVSGVLGFGIQAIVWPFTFIKRADKIRNIYTTTQIWVGSIGGGFVTIFNLIWFIYYQLASPTKSDFLRLMFPYIAIEIALWLCFYMFKGEAFKYLGTEHLMLSYDDEEEEEYTEEELDNEEEWVTFANPAFDF